MSYDALLAGVDRVRFRRACATLTDEALADELCARAEQRPPLERLDLLLRLLRELPIYSVARALHRAYPVVPHRGRRLLWQSLRAHLGRERSGAADAVETSLYANWFEDPDTVEDAWAALTIDEDPPVLRSALRASAPVPWRLKRTLLARLLPDPAWHDAVFGCLHSALHAFPLPTLDPTEALQALPLLSLPHRSTELHALAARLR